MLRVSVVGTSCSGKTTMARQIACRCHIPHIELDAIHWQPNWTPLDRDEFRSVAGRLVAGDQWVIDGNYSAVRDIVWDRATDVVWLNLPFALVLWRAIWRTGRRAITGEELWAGNRERLSAVLFSRDSIPWWVIQTHHRRRRQYAELFESGNHPDFTVHEVRKPAEKETVLKALQARAGGQADANRRAQLGEMATTR